MFEGMNGTVENLPPHDIPKSEIGNRRSRLLRAMRGEGGDRPPVICPGGMMTMATLSAMARAGCRWPEAHSDAAQMARAVLATQKETDLECLSAPFCMTVEAEALGCRVDMGGGAVLPHVAVESVTDASQIDGLSRFQNLDPAAAGRMPVVLEALRLLKIAAGDLPVIGAVVGPVTLAATVMDAGLFLRLTRRDPPAAERLIALCEPVVRRFALAQAQAGADCVMIAEPSATGEILGGRHFARLAVPALARLLRALKEAGVPSILHICGDVRTIDAGISEIAAGVGGPLALSVDSMVSGRLLIDRLPQVVRVGNVDTLRLHKGAPADAARLARAAARRFHVVSPACGLAPATPAENLRAMVRAVRGEDGS